MTDPTTNKNFDEFNPKIFFKQVISAGRYLLSKWKIILIVAFVCALLGATYSFFKKPNYVAEITFALDEGAGASARNAPTDLEEAFGIGTSLEAGGVFSSLTNIVELMQSRLLIEKALRDSINLNGINIIFADFFLDSLGYRDKWLKGTAYRNINFQDQKLSRSDSLFQNNIFKNIFEILTTKNLKIDKKGKGTTIISVTCVTENELFSKYFLEALLQEVTRYYIETKTQRSTILLAFIQKRTDSVKTAYYDALYGRASFSDAFINPIRRSAGVPGEKQQTDIEILRTSYIELVRSMESAKTSLMRDTPLIQYLDRPILPLKKLSSSILKYFLIFFFVGAFLAIAWLLVKKLGRHLMN